MRLKRKSLKWREDKREDKREAQSRKNISLGGNPKFYCQLCTMIQKFDIVFATSVEAVDI